MGTLCRSLVFFVSVALFSGALPKNSCFLGLPDSQLYFLTQNLVALPGFPLPVPWPVSWVNCKARLICFLSFKDHYPLLPDVQCLETVVSYILSVMFGFRWEGRSSLLFHFDWKWKSDLHFRDAVK